MNLQQLEYIVAIDQHRHFAKAAESCFVTQATLSMMVKKLEEELGLLLFDRSKQPVCPTDAGKEIIQQARIVLRESSAIKEISNGIKKEVKGELRMGIIPTLAPYLLPLFLNNFLKKYPEVHLNLFEISTAEILSHLEKDLIDIGILATPLHLEAYTEEPLFYEPFEVFVSKKENKLNKQFLLPKDLDINRLWLLEEGHCLRTQMLNLCELQKQDLGRQLNYEAGSIESLLRIVEVNQGITIVPKLATLDFNASRKKQLRQFSNPVPVREISMVSYRQYARRNLSEVLKKEIIQSVEGKLETPIKTKIVAL
jgi:LysR family hydrogen peroxide-inducible transcriptional activator